MIYRQHNCTAKHRTFKTFAKCVWPSAEWITGEGEYALIAGCGVITVALWGSYRAASCKKDLIDSAGCGSDCSYGPEHKIVMLVK